MAFAMPALLPRCHLGGGEKKTLSAPYSQRENQRVSPRSWGGSGEQSLAAGKGGDEGRGGLIPQNWGGLPCSGAGVCLCWSSQLGCDGANGHQAVSPLLRIVAPSGGGPLLLLSAYSRLFLRSATAALRSFRGFLSFSGWKLR